MSPPGLDRTRVSFLESLELAGKSPLTLDSYGRHLKEFETWLKANDKPLTVEEIDASDVRGFLLHVKRRPKRPGQSAFTTATGVFVGPASITRDRATQSAWMAWLHARLPDPERQKALKEALDKAYPPSRIRTALRVVVFGAGGWLVLTALEAIIEWFIQEWLSQLLPHLLH